MDTIAAMMKFLLASVVVLLFAGQAASLECYDCTGEANYDDLCWSDPDLMGDTKECDVCMTMEMDNQMNRTVARTCAPAGRQGCSSTTEVMGYSVAMECCYEDRCITDRSRMSVMMGGAAHTAVSHVLAVAAAAIYATLL